MPGSVEDVDIRRTVLGEVVVDSLVSAASVQVHHSDADTRRRCQPNLDNNTKNNNSLMHYVCCVPYQ